MKKEHREEYIALEPETRFEIIILYWIIKLAGKVGTTIKWQEKIESGLKTKRTSEIVTVIIEFDDIRLDHTIKSLRITGRVANSSKEELIGRRIGIDISINDTAIIPKNKTIERIIDKVSPKKSILIVILDIDGYIVAEVSDKIEIIYEKYISTAELLEDGRESFQKDLDMIKEVIKRYRENGTTIILGYNIGSKNLAKKIKEADYRIEGSLTANMNGILTILKELAKNREIRENNEVTRMIQIYDQILSGDPTKLIYGVDELFEKIDYGIVHTVIFTDRIIHDNKILDRLFEAFLSCIEVQFVDSHTSLGRYINQFGGLVGISY